MHLDELSQVGTWLSLVQNGERVAGIRLSEEVESYTVFMLMRHVHNTSLTDTPIALLFLRSLEEKNSIKRYRLEQTADCSLIIAGLFPERTRRARVSPDYFIQMSQMAYETLSHTCEAARSYNDAIQYEAMSHNTEKVAKVLSCSRK
jgi:hypothetical protein